MPFSMLKRGQWRYQLRRGGLPCEFKTFDSKGAHSFGLASLAGYGSTVLRMLYCGTYGTYGTGTQYPIPQYKETI